MFFLSVNNAEEEEKPDHLISSAGEPIKLHHFPLKLSSAVYHFSIPEAWQDLHALICMRARARMTLHVCSCRRVREVVRECMPFPVCLCLRDERPGESQGLSPNYLTHL